MKQQYKPYAYLIGWSDLNLWYYGIEISELRPANPNNLWIKYFTSSKIVKEIRIESGEPDVIQIRKTFNNKDEACLWESKVHRRLNVVKSKKWINGCSFLNKQYNGFKKGQVQKNKVNKTLAWRGGKLKLTSLDYFYSNNLEGQFKNTVVVIIDGEKKRISKKQFDEDKLKGHTLGYTHSINSLTGLSEYVLSTDKRWGTGELKGNQKDKKRYNDGNKIYMLYHDDILIEKLNLNLGETLTTSNKKKRKKWYNDGFKEYFIENKDIKENYIKGRLSNLNRNRKGIKTGSRWTTNGTCNIKINKNQNISEGFWFGRTNTKRPINNTPC